MLQQLLLFLYVTTPSLNGSNFSSGKLVSSSFSALAESFFHLPLKQNREPCSYTFPGFGTEQTVPDDLGNGGRIGVSYAYGTVDNTGL